MRSFSIFLSVYLLWLAMPPLGYAACLLLGVYFGCRIWKLMHEPDALIQRDLAQDLILVEAILGEGGSVADRGASGK